MRAPSRIQQHISGQQKGQLFPAPSILSQILIRGLKGGLIATAVMSLYRWPIFRALPPTAEFWAQFVGGGEADQYFVQGLVLHFLYGASGGVIFGPVFAVLNCQTRLDRERLGLGIGLVYGLALSVFGHRIIFRHLLDRELEDDEVLVFHVGHAIYGVTLGTWFGSRERFGEVYD
jgi:uncharacterized membrane protein YagU involved in acid resistance